MAVSSFRVPYSGDLMSNFGTLTSRRFAQQLERELQAKLKDREPLFEDINNLLHKYAVWKSLYGQAC